ncbi:DUF1735 and LamG domain-containing protein [Chitinophaga pendula]|uniref:DUF1735 and LamG domain-containing protein n=1 Tax=Chitinophaga TaxID=79328 RepID=UPI000BAEB974|nr:MULTISPECIES: DUF1735 and LamG domain-containing protein [Chitinophaga]ASZ12246.1 hypothetical protein CK934_15390 [Chitinophaga sp. MD30]UCJ10170.1 DUF1735 and LamG domain-containing protein [Chitinophaga pendula]
MKQIIPIVIMLLLATGIFSCKKETYSDALFITGTETNSSTALTVDQSASSTAISITSSGLASNDITVQLAIDTTLIAAYNQANRKNYKAPPSDLYSLSKGTVIIKSGTHISDAVAFTMRSNQGLQEGVSYMVPVTISHVSGGEKVLASSKTIFIIINKVIRSTVASITENYFKCDFSKNNDQLKNMRAISYEARVLVNNFDDHSPFISSLMGIEETYLLRFGDVTISKDQLQQAGGKPLTVPTSFATGRWYHIASTYDGSVQRIYVDGVLAVQESVSRTIDLTNTWAGGFHLGYSADGRLLDGLISECRVWSKALTQAEIQDGMCGVNPASPGLVAYWKLNEGTGNTAFDLSGNKHDAVAQRNVTWVTNVRCN